MFSVLEGQLLYALNAIQVISFKWDLPLAPEDALLDSLKIPHQKPASQQSFVTLHAKLDFAR